MEIEPKPENFKRINGLWFFFLDDLQGCGHYLKGATHGGLACKKLYLYKNHKRIKFIKDEFIKFYS